MNVMRYAIGDVHGCFKELRYLLEDEIEITRNDEVYFVGDLITKGNNNLEVLEYFMKLQQDGFQVSSVLGNHEYRVLYLFHNDFPLLESYLARYNAMDILNGEVDQLMATLELMPFYLELNDWIICHTMLGYSSSYGPSDARFLFGVDKFEDIYQEDTITNKSQVYGHIVRGVDDILADTTIRSKRIGIDGGCVYNDYACLCALNLDTYSLSYIKRE